MPSHACKHPTCTTIGPRPGYCSAHAKYDTHARHRKAERDRFYDRHERNQDAKRFYNSAEWLRARQTRITRYPVCERCGADWSRHVHHVIELAKCTPAQRTDQDNLRAVCIPCHNALEAETTGGPK